MPFRPCAALLGLALAAAAPPAVACGFHRDDPDVSERGRTRLQDLPAGIATGWTRCGGERPRSLVVWTLEIDPTLERVGVRDGPLFRELERNPFVAIGRIGLGNDRDFHLFRRRHGPDRLPGRVFGTLCRAGAAEPLDCSAGELRVKVRVDPSDRDRDGTADLDRHQVSIFDGRRLQVLTFNTAHETEPRRLAAHWIEALAIAGRL